MWGRKFRFLSAESDWPAHLRSQAFGVAQAGISLGQGAAMLLAGAAAQHHVPSLVVAGGGVLGTLAVGPWQPERLENRAQPWDSARIASNPKQELKTLSRTLRPTKRWQNACRSSKPF